MRRRVADLYCAKGWRAVVAPELEFYLIERERDANGFPQPPVMPGTGRHADTRQVFAMADLDGYGPFVDTAMTACKAQNIPANVAVSEYAPGQMEINLRHVEGAAHVGTEEAVRREPIAGPALGRLAAFDADQGEAAAAPISLVERRRGAGVLAVMHEQQRHLDGREIEQVEHPSPLAHVPH